MVELLMTRDQNETNQAIKDVQVGLIASLISKMSPKGKNFEFGSLKEISKKSKRSLEEL